MSERPAICFLAILPIVVACSANADDTSIAATGSSPDDAAPMARFASAEEFATRMGGGELSDFGEFPSLRVALAKRGLNDESRLSEVLNVDAMVQVGDSVFMVDAPHQLVGVAGADDLGARESLRQGNAQNPALRWFDTGDDVLDLVDAGSDGTLSPAEVDARLHREGAGVRLSVFTETSDHSDVNIFHDKRWTYDSIICEVADIPSPNLSGLPLLHRRRVADVKHTYEKAGIYFSLQSKIKVRENTYIQTGEETGEPVATDLELNVSFYYERKRRFRSDEIVSGSEAVSEFSNELSFRSYEGTRGLDKYTLETTAWYRDYHTCPESTGTGDWRSVTLEVLD